MIPTKWLSKGLSILLTRLTELFHGLLVTITTEFTREIHFRNPGDTGTPDRKGGGRSKDGGRGGDDGGGRDRRRDGDGGKGRDHDRGSRPVPSSLIKTLMQQVPTNHFLCTFWSEKKRLVHV